MLQGVLPSDQLWRYTFAEFYCSAAIDGCRSGERACFNLADLAYQHIIGGRAFAAVLL